MTDAAVDPAHDGQPTVEQTALVSEQLASDPDEPLGLTSEAVPPQPLAVPGPPAADEHPEYAVGAAFAGGLAVALLLKRLAR